MVRCRTLANERTQCSCLYSIALFGSIRSKTALCMAHNMVFWILTPHKIEAHEHNLSDFIADDVMYAIQSTTTKIATDKVCLENLQKQYPSYHRYEISVGKL